MAAKKKSNKTGNSLSDIQANINKLHGENALTTLNEGEYDVPRIPTGIRSVDKILGGGLPKGKFAVASGREGGGKSAMALMFAAQAQKEGKVVYIDLENSFDPRKAENSGIDLDEIFISQPGSAEGTLEVIEMCLSADDVSAIIIDSVAAMATKAQIAGDYDDAHVAGLARVMSLGLNKINTFMMENHKDTIIFFVNQIRDIIGGAGGYGPTTTTPGGRALKFYASTLLEVSRIGNLSKGSDSDKHVVGQTSRVTLKKSRFSAPFQKADFDIYFDTGVSNESLILEDAVEYGLVALSGAWYADIETGEKLGQGKMKALAFLAENPDYMDSLVKKLDDIP